MQKYLRFKSCPKCEGDMEYQDIYENCSESCRGIYFCLNCTFAERDNYAI